MSQSKLHLADLREAQLSHANLFKASLQDTSLTGANLQEANLLETTHVSVDLLVKVKTLYLARLDQTLLEQLTAEAPHLLTQQID